jgi:2-polyprenyl-3-methyl-5-hydroxy-6-metoxy-1,4-benzoquinol methylase
MKVKYSKPRMVKRIEDCFFYHVMELPGTGLVGEHWDLRDTVDEYLGYFQFHGMRVLDVGAASGFLTFEMEKRGATVVSFDIGSDMAYDIVPYANPAFNIELERNNLHDFAERLINSYWYAHHALNSRAKAYYGDIYNLPDFLGRFDAVVLGSVLLHVRDPFSVLQSATRLTAGTVIITNPFFDSDLPVMHLIPTKKNYDEFGYNVSWWHISDMCMVRMLEILGFDKVTIRKSEHKAIFGGNTNYTTFSTFVGTR